MHAPNFEGVLSALDYVVIEFIPKRDQFSTQEVKSVIIYQRLTAANFGPGNFAIGLKYSRFTASPTRYTSHAATIATSTEEIEPLENESILYRCSYSYCPQQ